MPRRSESRLAALPLLADDDLGLAEVDPLEDLVGGVAEDDQHRVQRGDGEHRVDRVLEQRATAKIGELLGAAEAPTGPGGEDETSRRVAHVIPSSMSVASASSDAIELPGSNLSTCGIAAFMPRVSGS